MASLWCSALFRPRSVSTWWMLKLWVVDVSVKNDKITGLILHVQLCSESFSKQVHVEQSQASDPCTIVKLITIYVQYH